MPRNFFDLKSGGGQFLCCPPTLKSGGTRPPRPPPIDARSGDDLWSPFVYEWCKRLEQTFGWPLKCLRALGLR